MLFTDKVPSETTKELRHVALCFLQRCAVSLFSGNLLIVIVTEMFLYCSCIYHVSSFIFDFDTWRTGTVQDNV